MPKSGKNVIVPLENVLSRIENSYLRSIDSKMVGQEDVKMTIVTKIANIANRLFLGRKPIGTFFLAGPRGSGKSLLVDTISEIFYGQPGCVTFADCDELNVSTTGTGSLEQIDFEQYARNLGAKIETEKKMVATILAKIEEQNDETTEDDTNKKLIQDELLRIKKEKEEEISSLEDTLVGATGVPLSIIVFENIDRAMPTTLTLIRSIIESGSWFPESGVQSYFNNTFIIMTPSSFSEPIVDFLKKSGVIKKEKGRWPKYEKHVKEITEPETEDLTSFFEFLKFLGEENILVLYSLSDEEIMNILEKKLLGMKINRPGSSNVQEVEFTDDFKKAVIRRLRSGFHASQGIKHLDQILNDEITPRLTRFLYPPMNSPTLSDTELNDGTIVFDNKPGRGVFTYIRKE